MQTIVVDGEMVTKIGTVAVLVIGGLITFVVELVKRQVYRRMDQAEEERAAWQKEQVEDQIRASRGQQIMSDTLTVLLRHIIYGDHVEDLERSQEELAAFKRENNEAMLRKAAKYNIR